MLDLFFEKKMLFKATEVQGYNLLYMLITHFSTFIFLNIHGL